MTVADHRSMRALAAPERRRRVQARAFRGDRRDASRAWVFRSPRGKLHGRGRRAASPPRRDPRALSAVAARRRPLDRLARTARPRPSSDGSPRSPGASSRRSFPSTSRGRRTRAPSSTIFCPCPTRTKRSRGCRSISTRCRTRSGGRCCSKIPRPMSCSPKARGRRPISCARSRAAPAAAFCSTSTTCSSAPSITASIPSAISPIFRFRRSAKSTSRATPTTRDDAGLPLLIDAHNSPVRDPVWSLYARDDPPARADADADRMGQRRARLADAPRRSAPGGARDCRCTQEGLERADAV